MSYRRRRRKKKVIVKSKMEIESKSENESDTDTEDEIPEEVIKIPEELLGPISFSIFKDPVVASDGFTYERDSILDWFDRCKRKKIGPVSPMTNKPMKNKRLTNNRKMKKKCEEFKLNRKKFAEILKMEQNNNSYQENKTESFQIENSFQSEQTESIIDLTQINEQKNQINSQDKTTNLSFEEQMKLAIELSSSPVNTPTQSRINTNTNTNNDNQQNNRQLTEEEQLQLVLEMSLGNNNQNYQNTQTNEDQMFLEILERSKMEK
ncbi:wd repeat sam and u-box domain-containing protein [Anaeramoeba flamelloides]|uniref:Wd repeat sam and u-box domain-containing protein n=1 Tax=Anaeramoeba flamelloides TaxID=1746091 RepID=A0AAV7Z1S5_9EUKA|nr:wd repeat sam and u-box domain-containing protein [Anaeramoeba flamelloides]